ncbi:MAG: hypothetical protein AAB778_03160 [Patescibacteria group bacterium]
MAVQIGSGNLAEGDLPTMAIESSEIKKVMKVGIAKQRDASMKLHDDPDAQEAEFKRLDELAEKLGVS